MWGVKLDLRKHTESNVIPFYSGFIHTIRRREEVAFKTPMVSKKTPLATGSVASHIPFSRHINSLGTPIPVGIGVAL